jgi:hypothetical protein
MPAGYGHIRYTAAPIVTDDQPSAEVPLPIMLFGWFLIAGGVAFALSIAVTGGAFSPSRSAFNAASKLVGAVSGYGFLRLKRWGPILYLAGFAANTTFFYLVPPSQEALARYSTPTSLVMLFVIPSGVAVLTAKYWRRFS